MSIKIMRFTLVDNALDFVRSALESAEKGTDKDLKYAILHLADGVELILKERLKKEHWSLLFADINKANEKALKLGDFKSVDFNDCVTRLGTIASIDLTAYDNLLRSLRGTRNRLQHFEFTGTKDEVVAILVQTWVLILDFLHDYLPDVVKDQAEQIDEIKKLMIRNKNFLRKRWTGIQSELDRFKKDSDAVLDCPRCLQSSLLIPGIDEAPNCLFCRYSASPDEAVDDWIYEFLGYTDPKDALMDPAKYICWMCGHNTLVHIEDSDMTPPSPAWVCFNCGNTAEWDEVGRCDTCGEHYQKREDDWGMCSDCVEAQMEKD